MGPPLARRTSLKCWWWICSACLNFGLFENIAFCLQFFLIKILTLRSSWIRKLWETAQRDPVAATCSPTQRASGWESWGCRPGPAHSGWPSTRAPALQPTTSETSLPARAVVCEVSRTLTLRSWTCARGEFYADFGGSFFPQFLLFWKLRSLDFSHCGDR